MKAQAKHIRKLHTWKKDGGIMADTSMNWAQILSMLELKKNDQHKN